MNGRSAPRAVLCAHRTRGSVGRCHGLTERLRAPTTDRWKRNSGNRGGFPQLNRTAFVQILSKAILRLGQTGQRLRQLLDPTSGIEFTRHHASFLFAAVTVFRPAALHPIETVPLRSPNPPDFSARMLRFG